MRPGKPDGNTCCQDSNLRNEESKHKRRVDMVFASPEPSRVKANVLYDKPTDKIEAELWRPALWPSDHSGVSVRLKYGSAD